MTETKVTSNIILFVHPLRGALANHKLAIKKRADTLNLITNLKKKYVQFVN